MLSNRSGVQSFRQSNTDGQPCLKLNATSLKNGSILASFRCNSWIEKSPARVTVISSASRMPAGATTNRQFTEAISTVKPVSVERMATGKLAATAGPGVPIGLPATGAVKLAAGTNGAFIKCGSTTKNTRKTVCTIGSTTWIKSIPVRAVWSHNAERRSIWAIRS